MALFDAWISTAQDIGVFQYVLPFLLTFVIIYGILERIELLGDSGDKGSKLHAVAAFSIATFITAFTPAGTTLGALFTNYFGALAVALVGVLGAMILIGLLFPGRSEDDGPVELFESKWRAVVVIGGAALLFFYLSGGIGSVPWVENLDAGLGAYSMQHLIGILVVVGTVVLLGWTMGFIGDSDGS